MASPENTLYTGLTTDTYKHSDRPEKGVWCWVLSCILVLQLEHFGGASRRARGGRWTRRRIVEHAATLDFRCWHPARQISPEMRAPPPARPASSRRPGVTVNAAYARLALATAYVGMWADLESSRGVWLTDVHAQVTRATPATGKANSTAEAEAWCAKPLPKQDKQTYKSKNREATIVGFRLEAGLEIGGAVKQRPSVLRDLKGKKVDNGWGWGMQRTLGEADATPLIELGILTLDCITTPQGTAMMGVEGFKRKFPTAKARHVRSLMKARRPCVW